MLKTIFASLVGLTLTIGGLSINVGDILNDTKTAANSANIYQLTTALEMYYSEHDYYPMTRVNDQLLAELGPYLRNKPSGLEDLIYRPSADGQDYELSFP